MNSKRKIKQRNRQKKKRISRNIEASKAKKKINKFYEL